MENHKALNIDEELGFKYYDEHNYALAYHHLLMAANNNNGKCANKIGLMYYLGKYVKKDDAKAIAWYLKAADLGYKKAYGNIGYYYDFVEQNASKAFQWYIKGAKLLDPNCQCKVGLAYENAHGVEQDYSKAYYWYNEAANQHYARAYYHLGKLYYNGYQIPKNHLKACETFLIGAKLNDKFALQELVIGCAKGEFQVTQNDLSWIVDTAKKVLKNNTHTTALIEKAEQLLTNKPVVNTQETETKTEKKIEIVKDSKENHPKYLNNTTISSKTSVKAVETKVEVCYKKSLKEDKNEKQTPMKQDTVKIEVNKDPMENHKALNEENLDGKSINIAVIGMDGDGKSTFIASLAKTMEKDILPEVLKQQKNTHHYTHVSCLKEDIQFNIFESTSEHVHVLEMIQAMGHIDAVIFVYDVIKGMDLEVNESVLLQIRTLAKQEPKRFITFFNKCDQYDEDDVEECIDLGQEDLYAHISEYHNNDINFYHGSALSAYQDSYSDDYFTMIDIIEDVFAYAMDWILDNTHKNHILIGQKYYEEALSFDQHERYAEAESSYLLAIDYGHIDAMYNYADMILRLSQNTNSNITTAEIYKLFEKAANAGSQKAMQWLYASYRKDNNTEKANYWLNKINKY